MIARRTTKVIAVACTVGAVLTIGAAAFCAGEQTRPAACAGTWYPEDSGKLAEQIDALLAGAAPPTITGRPIAVVAPHAGYRFSAPVAAAGYACLKGQTYKRVIVLAFSHRNAGSYRGIDVPGEFAAYATPLGDVPIDRAFCDKLLEHKLFAAHPGVDAGEHSLELQLPFLQRVLGQFALVPLYVGRMSDSDNAEAAQAIVSSLDDDTLLVVSSDFTHFGANYGYFPFREDVPNKLRELADDAERSICRCDYDGFETHLEKTGDTICGRGPLLLLLRILSMQGGAEGVRTAFDTSGQMTGDWSSSVTYQSFVFTRRPGTLGDAERQALLRLARQTVTDYLRDGSRPRVDADALPAKVRGDGACFVTLENHGQLRGCIGNMVAQGPLYRAVIDNAVSACKDYRFVGNPVTTQELGELHIEISYLTPMQPVDDTNEIVIGKHGLMIELGNYRGVLLPQVAYERGWTRAEFLQQVCHKAGLSADAWKRPEARIYSFEAEVFGEPEEER